MSDIVTVGWRSPAGEIHTVWTTPERADQMRAEGVLVDCVQLDLFDQAELSDLIATGWIVPVSA